MLINKLYGLYNVAQTTDTLSLLQSMHVCLVLYNQNQTAIHFPIKHLSVGVPAHWITVVLIWIIYSEGYVLLEDVI